MADYKHSSNIFPVHDRILQRADKEEALNQHALAIWMTGLSGSGKTTLAIALEKLLHEKGLLTQVLDGDNIRSGINKNLGFSDADRTENIRRIAEVNKLFLNCGIITINCFVSPTFAIREHAKGIIGEDDFVEVFVDAPVEICEARDVKGLYKKARSGEIKNFTGIDAPFDPPVSPAVHVKTDQQTVDEAVQAIASVILSRITR